MSERRIVCVVVAAFVVTLAAHPSAAAADNWIGTWKLDPAKSQFNPGPGPKSQTITYTPSQGGWVLKSDAVDAQGQAVKSGYSVQADGKDHPWTGNPNADTLMARRVDDNSFETTWKKAGKVTITSNVVVSNGGKTLTVHQTGTDAEGRDVRNTMVFTRQ